jgi:hypothetical protein
MIQKGSTAAGLGDVMNAEVQREALRLVVSKQLVLDGAESEGTEEEPASAADIAEVEEDDDGNEDVEEDEGEVDVDVYLAACWRGGKVGGGCAAERSVASRFERTSESAYGSAAAGADRAIGGAMRSLSMGDGLR